MSKNRSTKVLMSFAALALLRVFKKGRTLVTRVPSSLASPCKCRRITVDKFYLNVKYKHTNERKEIYKKYVKNAHNVS